MGFPIQKSPDQRFVGTSPKRIAASRVFHRHVEPRHPPYALDFLLGNLEIMPERPLEALGFVPTTHSPLNEWSILLSPLLQLFEDNQRDRIVLLNNAHMIGFLTKKPPCGGNPKAWADAVTIGFS